MKPDELKPKASVDKEVVYVDVDDEITSIIDKLESSKAKVVALVLPKRAATLQSIVNMRLLARSAKNAGKNPVLVTTETALLPLAGAAGLHVASSLESKPEVPPAPDVPRVPIAEEAADSGAKGLRIRDNSTSPSEDLPSKIDYDRSVGELAEAHGVGHPETIELGAVEAEASSDKTAKTPKIKGLKVPNFDRFRLMLGLAVVGVIALIVFIILALFVLPKATIAITTTSTPVSASLTLNASDKTTSLDEKNSNIPSALKSSDQTGAQQVTATGQQNNGTKASGTITLSQDPCSHAPTVPGGTGLSSNGLAFTTDKSVTLSSLSFDTQGNTVCSGDVGVTAQNGGAKYNLASGSTFAVSGYPSVTGRNASAISGGTDNVQTVVSQNDVDGAKQKITSGTTADSFVKNFENTLAQQGLYVLTSTLKTADAVVTASPDVGQPASNTTVTVKVTYSVLTVKKADLQKAIEDALNSQIDKTKQKVDDSTVLNDAQVAVASQASPTTAVLSITEATSAVPILDIATVKKQAEGQKAGDVMASLNGIPGVKNVSVNLSPFWVSKVPKSAGKITVTIQHVNGTNSGG